MSESAASEWEVVQADDGPIIREKRTAATITAYSEQPK